MRDIVGQKMAKKKEIVMVAKAIGRTEQEVWEMSTQEYYEQLNVLEQMMPADSRATFD